MLAIIVISLLFVLSFSDSYEQYEYEPSYYDYQDYEYDDQCNCQEICGDEGPEDWEFEYDEVPQCIINNCGVELDTCASAEPCVVGIEGMVQTCYNNNENPMQCMDDLVQDQEAGKLFKEVCNDDQTCATDLKELAKCVINSANYGFCPEDEYKKLQLKSLRKTVQIRSRKNKRKAIAAKQLKSRSSKRKQSKSRRKVRGKKASKLRASRRKLQGDYNDYGYDNYDYGCYCDCGEEEDEIPDCVEDNCGEQLIACGSCGLCVNAVEGVKNLCYENNDNPQECMDELIQESDGTQAMDLCEGNEICAGDLQALGECVINAANYGFCTDDEYKKLKIKALVKTTKKVRARKVASSQKRKKSKSRKSSKRARRKNSAKVQRRKRSRKQRRVRPRSQRQRQSGARAQAKAQRLRSKKLKSKKSRRKLLTSGCCECTDSSDSPNCNDECDGDICSFDSYCCDVEWDFICANAAQEKCEGNEEYGYEDPCGYEDTADQYDYDYDYEYGEYEPAGPGTDYNYNYEYEGDYDWNYEEDSDGEGCCGCTDAKDEPFCNEECDSDICSWDPYCCNYSWDFICANSANQICDESEGGEETGTGNDESCCDCTAVNDDAGCGANPECESIVCPLDSYCCNNSWDSICANGANNICNAAEYWSWEQSDYGYDEEEEPFYEDSYDSYNTGTTGSCCECTTTSGSPGCNAVCDNEVCPLDSYCCNNQWDSICANGATNICQGYDYFNQGGGYDYNNYQDSYGFNYEPYSGEYSYSYYSPSPNYQPYDYSDNYDYNGGAGSYSYYDSYSPSPNIYDSFNNYDYSDNYQPDSYSYYSDSGEFTYSNEPYYNSGEYSNYDGTDSYDYSSYDSYYPPSKGRKVRKQRRSRRSRVAPKRKRGKRSERTKRQRKRRKN